MSQRCTNWYLSETDQLKDTMKAFESLRFKENSITEDHKKDPITKRSNKKDPITEKSY